MDNANSTPETITIQLTQGQTTVISAVDAELARHKWCAALMRDYRDGGKYIAMRTDLSNGRKTVMLHRVILERVLGRKMARNEFVDHISGDPLDNRRENLRLATPSQNTSNAKKPSSNTSGYKGVSWVNRDQRWIAKIGKDYKEYYLGSFDTKEEAYAAYCEAAKRLHGEFANLE